MRIRIALVALVAAVVVAVPAQAAGEKPQNFKAVAKVQKSGTDGRFTTFREVVKQRGKRIGTSRFRCNFRSKRPRCFGRYKVRGGAIFVGGVVEQRKSGGQIPIVGGSKAYDGARGTYRFERMTRRKNRVTFNFRR